MWGIFCTYFEDQHGESYSKGWKWLKPCTWLTWTGCLNELHFFFLHCKKSEKHVQMLKEEKCKHCLGKVKCGNEKKSARTIPININICNQKEYVYPWILCVYVHVCVCEYDIYSAFLCSQNEVKCGEWGCFGALTGGSYFNSVWSWN